MDQPAPPPLIRAAQLTLATLMEWLHQLSTDEIDFLEGGSEDVLIEGSVFQHFAARGNAWAASLAAAMRPHMFGLGAAPLALAGLAPSSMPPPEPKNPLPALLATAIGAAAGGVAAGWRTGPRGNHALAPNAS